MSKPKPKKRSVHVAVPTYGATPAICQLSFGSFIGQGVAAGLITHIGEVDGAYIDRSRNDLVRQAIENGSTHLMFVDQDMIIPEGTVSRLIAHEVPFVGGSYWGKDDYFTPVSFHLDPFRRIYELDECEAVDTSSPLPEGVLDCWCGKPDNHLHRIGGPGMGCTLISVEMLRDVEAYFTKHECPCGAPGCAPQRWFSSQETGEDVHLALRCAEMGIDRHLDGFVQCGHVRNQIVTRQHYDWARLNAPKCRFPGCDRVAYHHVGEDDTAEQAKRCFAHREENE